MTDTLKQNWEFRRAYSRGKCYSAPGLVTYIVKKRSGNVRIGITTGKKIGNAVTRSRARRVIRAAFNSLPVNKSVAADIVFVARTRTPAMKSTEICRIMQSHLAAAGILTEHKD